MSQAPVEINVENPEPEAEAAPVADTGDTIVVTDGGGGDEVAIQTGANAAEIEQLKARIAELEFGQEMAPTISEVVEVAESVAAEVAAPVAEEVSEETVEEVAAEIAEEAERTEPEPGGTHWLFRPANEWRHGKNGGSE